jgi:hypothetical protein
MVSLAIQLPYGTASVGFVNNALWYPDIPERSLQLNEIYFKSRTTVESGFQPLCISMDRGSPSKLTLITEFETSKTRAIRCLYDTGRIQRLGSYTPEYHLKHEYSYLIKRGKSGKNVDEYNFLRQERITDSPKVCSR